MPTIEELKYLQSQPLERKINITITRIIEWYQRFNGQVYVSFSGGKDSTVLLDLARRIYPDIEAVFIDTGLEYPEIREFVKTKDNITWLRPKINFKEVIEKYGYPVISKRVSRQLHDVKKHGKSCWAWRCFDGEEKGSYEMKRYKYLIDSPFRISDKCCAVMKKAPVKEYGKKVNKKAVIGTMTDESQQRQTTWLQQGCNAFDNKNPISTPMSFWTEQDVLRYLKETKIPYASIYGNIVAKTKLVSMEELEQLVMEEVPTDLMTTGVNRTGCMFCMFGVHLEQEPNRFQRMKITHPKQYDYCIREENGLGLGKVLDYINVKY
jgi:3'-phosphoadenosine 5'-phosphosulfate sulfotransferase (PAPS reductase)/FAD synthetase